VEFLQIAARPAPAIKAMAPSAVGCIAADVIGTVAEGSVPIGALG
jgi:hypothetical protein